VRFGIHLTLLKDEAPRDTKHFWHAKAIAFCATNILSELVRLMGRYPVCQRSYAND